MSENIIEVHDLDFGYDPSYPVLKDVNFSIKNRENCCIIGPNGGGKTTLLKLMLGFLKPDRGSISILGQNIEDVCRRIGYMPQVQKISCDFPISVLEVVMTGTICGTNFVFFDQKKRKIALDKLEKMNVAHLAKRNFHDISGGEKQRVLIARALSSEPEILLLDEPTANIDPGAEQCFYDMLDELQQDMTLLTVSHDLGFVSRNISRIICVNRSVKVHSPAEINSRNIEELYHHSVQIVEHNDGCLCPHQKHHTGKHI